MWFLVSLLSIFGSGLGVILHVAYKRRQLLSRSWASILAKLETVDLEGLREIAECYLRPGKDQLRIEPEDMWRTVGGLRGIERLRHNANIMLELAVYAERWDSVDGRIVSEMMRRDAARLKKAILTVELARLSSIGLVRAPFSLQEAISSYCLMRDRLVGLYQMAHVGLLPQLEAAL